MKINTLSYCFLSIILIILLSMKNVTYANNNMLTISVPPFSPFNKFLDNTPSCEDFGIKAIKNIAQSLKTELNVVAYPYTRILNTLKTGELDLAFIFKNTTIANDTHYIGPLSYSKIIVLTREDISIKKYVELYILKNIAVIKGAQFNDQFDQDDDLHKVNVATYQQAVRLLQQKTVNAVIGSKTGLAHALRLQNMDESLLDNAFELGTKEWGLHLSRNSSVVNLLPKFQQAVKEKFDEDFVYHTYQVQDKSCLTE